MGLLSLRKASKKEVHAASSGASLRAAQSASSLKAPPARAACSAFVSYDGATRAQATAAPFVSHASKAELAEYCGPDAPPPPLPAPPDRSLGVRPGAVEEAVAALVMWTSELCQYLFKDDRNVAAAPKRYKKGSSFKRLKTYPPVVVCGPSGVGKGTLLNRLIAEFPNDFSFTVSHTTREPRPGEEDGVHYHFCQPADMERMISEGAFIEWATVHAALYGTSIDAVKAVSAQGKTCLLDIDVQGASAVKETTLNARFIFVAPPSLAVLEARLRGRGTESEEKILLRMQSAAGEMACLDKPGFFDAVIVNDDLDSAYAKFKELLLPPSLAQAAAAHAELLQA